MFDTVRKAMRILIYGAGVIGSLYAALLSETEQNVSVYARGKRLESLKEHGLLYRRKGEVRTAEVNVLQVLDPDDKYDFIILTVRENQLMQALRELKSNCSQTIVTMVNSLDTYDNWEEICGKGRILPAFPGASGGFDGDILEADLTPRLIQPTTIGRTDGREKRFADILKMTGIPCQIVPDMHVWQICHLGMVVPIADAYYETDDPENAGMDRALMKRTAGRIKGNFKIISRMGMKLSPAKLNIFRMLPLWFIAIILGFVFRSRFGDRFMYRHSVKAPDEMRHLHDELNGFLNKGKKNDRK